MHQEAEIIFSDVQMHFDDKKQGGRDLILRSEAPSLESEVKDRDNPELDDDLIYKRNGFFVRKKDCSVQSPLSHFLFAIRNMKFLI